MQEILQNILSSVTSLEYYKGYPYLIQAVLMVVEKPERLQNIDREIYQILAKQYGTKSECISKNLRTVRDAFMNAGGGKKPEEISGCVAWNRQKPTPRELIGILAEDVRKKSKFV